MPSFLHEALLELLRGCPRLAPDLARAAVQLPRYTEAQLCDSALAEVVPAAWRADLVVTLTRRGRPRHALIVEIQLARDPAKTFAWPAYQQEVRSRLRLPATLVVVAPEARVARWAARPIDTGQPGCDFTPVVLGPEQIPVVNDREQARRAPELAVFAVLAHRHDRQAAAMALAAVEATRGLDEERAALYLDLVLGGLGAAVRRELEALMASGHYEYQSEFARKYFAQGLAEGEAKGKAEGEAKGEAKGKAEGKAEALLAIVAARGLTISSEQRARILACTALATLDEWIGRAVRAASVEEVLA